jgi:LPS-assembly protein
MTKIPNMFETLRRSNFKRAQYLIFFLFLSFSVTEHPLGFSGRGTAEAQEAEQERPVPPDTVRVKADSLTFDQRSMSGTATGGVRILYEGAILEAEEVFLDLDDKTSYARRRVRLLQGRDTLYCEELQYHWETQTGSLKEGELLFEETGYYIRGDLLEKTGQDTYAVQGGSFTTCRCPDPGDRVPWEMRAREGEITLGGYAKVKKATFRILGVPVLYIPSGYLPVKMDRESGFLVPGIGSSGSNGWEFLLPYYWAINASYDATFVLEGLTKRGAKPGVEFRYRPNKDTAGQWNLSMLYDMEVDEFRYGLRAEHIQKLSSSFYDKLELKVVSDNDYTEDFPWEVASPSDRILESRGIVGFHKGNFHTTLEGNFSDVVAEIGGDKVPQLLPSVHVDYVRRPVGVPWLSLGWRSDAVHFVDEMGDKRWRQQIFPQGLVLLSPAPGLALKGGVGIREILSQYVGDSFGGEGSQHRTLLETGAEAEGTVGRGFQWGDYRLFHIIRPKVGYQYIHEITSDPFPVVMDGLDMLVSRNFLTYSIYTSLWGKMEDVLPAGRKGMVGELYVVQSLDLDQDPVDSPTRRLFSDVRIRFRLQPRYWLGLMANLQIDPYDGTLRAIEVGTTLRDNSNRFGLELGFLEHKEHIVDPLTRVELWDSYDLVWLFPGIDQTLRAQVRARINRQWSFSLDTLYLIELSGKIENHLSVTYLSVCDCWSVVLKVNQTVRPDDVGFSVLFRLAGLGSYY